MNRTVDTWREAIESARDELLALPSLRTCPPEESIRALTRSHLEITMKSNGEQLALPLTCAADRDVAFSISHDYREIVHATISTPTRCFIHSERIISGKHTVAPQLSFLSEVSSREPPNHPVWYCHTPLGFTSYRSGPVVTHLTTALRDPPTVRQLSDFSPTPLFSAVAFMEDLQRISDGGARLAIGLGEPSYLLSLAISEIGHLKPSKWGFQPSCIGSINVEIRSADSAIIRIATTSLGVFHLLAKHTPVGQCTVELSPPGG